MNVENFSQHLSLRTKTTKGKPIEVPTYLPSNTLYKLMGFHLQSKHRGSVAITM